MRLRNVLTSFTDFSWADLPMAEQAFEDYKSKYLDLYDKVRRDHSKDKVSILEDIDFELELIHRDEINVTYILKLLAKLHNSLGDEAALAKKAIMNALVSEVELRSKQDLIEKFINENLPYIENVDLIPEEFDKYWNEQRILALNQLCHEEHLDMNQFQNLIDDFIYSEQLPIRDEVFKCLETRPSVLKAKEIGEHIIDRMMAFVEVFIKGVVA